MMKLPICAKETIAPCLFYCCFVCASLEEKIARKFFDLNRIAVTLTIVLKILTQPRGTEDRSGRSILQNLPTPEEIKR